MQWFDIIFLTFLNSAGTKTLVFLGALWGQEEKDPIGAKIMVSMPVLQISVLAPDGVQGHPQSSSLTSGLFPFPGG